MNDEKLIVKIYSKSLSSCRGVGSVKFRTVWLLFNQLCSDLRTKICNWWLTGKKSLLTQTDQITKNAFGDPTRDKEFGI